MKKVLFYSVATLAALWAWTPLHANENGAQCGYSACGDMGCGETGNGNGSSCGIDDLGCDISCFPKKKKSLWNFGGNVEVGVYGNSHGSGNDYFHGGPGRTNASTWDPMSANSWLLGPARQTGVQMNQAWLFFEKELDTSKGFDIGGRIDVLYGTDSVYGGSRGLDLDKHGDPWGEGDYMLTLPQLYAELGYRNFSVKLGKFGTPIGYEGVYASDRFFYSASYAFEPAPTSQTGALGTWNVSDSFSVFAGISCGFDEDGNSSFFHDVDGGAALFGFDYDINKCWSIGYGGMLGKRNNAWGVPGVDRDFYYHSLIIKYVPNACWDYTFEWFLENSRTEGVVPGTGGFRINEGVYTYGIHQQLVRKLNNRWAVGFRGEWAQYDRVNGWKDANLCELTFGANWTPCKNLLIRPEVRYDFSDRRVFDDDSKKDQFGAGMSAIVKF